jgi:flagellar hook assembly protein FlgD
LVKKEGNLNTESIGIPKSFVLHPNYPNPFNPQTQIKFEIPYASNVDLSVYNILGVKVKTLYSGQKPPGTFVFKWDGKNENDQLVSGGVYIYQLKTEKDIQMRKMILLK